MKTRRGFVELIDKAGNQISVPESRAESLIKGGYRRASDPPPVKKSKPTETGSE